MNEDIGKISDQREAGLLLYKYEWKNKLHDALDFEEKEISFRNGFNEGAAWQRIRTAKEAEQPINDGGSAFPHHETTSLGEPYHDHLGMTLRDWFAGQALAGMCSDPERMGGFKDFAETAYRLSDAMLAERAKKGGAL